MKILKFLLNIELSNNTPQIASLHILQKDFEFFEIYVSSTILNITSKGLFRRNSVGMTVEPLIRLNTAGITHINVNCLQLPLNQFFSEDSTVNTLLITIEIPEILPELRRFAGFISALSGQVPNIEIIHNDFGAHSLDGEIDAFSLSFAQDIDSFSTDMSISNDKNDAPPDFAQEDPRTFTISTQTSFAFDKSLIQITEFPDAWQS